MFTAKGKIIFKLRNTTGKFISREKWLKNAIISTRCDLEAYYAWFIKKRFSLELDKTLRGTHVTILSDKLSDDIYEEAFNLFNNKEITFQYFPEKITTNGRYWWIPVKCEDAETIREMMGLSRKPYHDFHLTLGRVNDKNLEHSKYISEIIKFHNL